MTRTFALTSTTALLTLLAPQFALAKVSAEDVWANQIAMHKALGGATTGALEVKGNVTTIRDMNVDFALPMNLGAITLKINAIDLVENGDETVTMRYPAGSVIDLSVDVPGQMSGNIAVGFANGTFDARASGEAGNIVYSYDNPGYGVEITEFNLDGPALSNGDLAFLKEFAMTGVVDITDYNGTIRVSEGDMLTIDASLATGSSVSKFTIDGGELVQGSQNSTAGASDFTAMMKLPSDGVGIFEWPAALRNGMSVMFNSKVNDSAGTQEMLSNGQPISYTNDSLDVLEASFGLDASGITVTGAADGYSIDTLDPSFPLPIKATAARVIGEFAMPLLASDDPQAFVYGMGFEDVVIDESLMGMIDPTQGLGRDPITMRLNTKGNVGTTLDLLDFPALMALEQEYNMPFSIHDFSITELYLAAAGAELNGVGDFTFDMNNLDTFDGIPAPTGALDLSMVGFNGLLDKLVAAGFLPEQQAMGARMMTGLFAQPGAGEDSLTSKIEIDGATGAISANGQRLQ